MRILYAIQGTGNGHLSRARDIVPVLAKLGEVDLLVSGSQADVDLPFDVKFRFKGLSFVFGKKGGVDMLSTFIKAKSKRLYNEIKQLPVEDYDLVISDFEPVSAWACRQRDKLCVGLSHQCAVLLPGVPKPAKADLIGKKVLMFYAPATVEYGFHFKEYSANTFTPVIRRQIREAPVTDGGHYTVYLPAFGEDKLLKTLKKFPEVEWQVFSKHSSKERSEGNVHLFPVSNDRFIESFISCTGVLCGAGFETPAEALHMKKKLMVIPMKGQYEQQCNAAALADMGVPVIKSLKSKHHDKIKDWIASAYVPEVNYPDRTEEILRMIVEKHGSGAV